MTAQHPEIPDPVSAEQGDPHYSPWSHVIQVKLDGEVVRDCVAASAKEGWVRTHVRTDDGRLVAHGEVLLIEERRGSVELSWIVPGDQGMPRPTSPNDKPESPAA